MTIRQAGLAALVAGRAFAAERGAGDVWSAMGSKVRSSDSGDVTSILFAFLALIVGLIVVSRAYAAFQARRAAPPGSRGPGAAPGPQSFRHQAVALGFRASELGALRQIAGRLAPRSPQSLLTSGSGRQRLIGDLDKRIRRREREVNLLNHMLQRLETARAGHYHARETIRVETDISIWFVQKVQTEDAAAEGEETLVNMEPVTGRLLDLSEGGAAVAVDLPLNPGEMVEFWSADTQIWIPPLPAGVVSIDAASGVTGPVVHLHFLDPPLADIRRAMQDIQLMDREAEPGAQSGESPPAAPPESAA
ncbi:MAG: PilZ domain-containing protein [Gemmatimonadota bacterium]